MKHLRILCLILVVMGILVFSGCASNTPSSSTQPPASSSSATTSVLSTTVPVETIKLSLATFGTSEDYISPVFMAWADELQKKTNGKYKVEIAWGGALGPLPEHFDMVRTGVCDIAYLFPTLTPGLFPVTETMMLPLNIPDYSSGSKAYWSLYKNGYLDKELADVVVLNLWAGEGSVLYTTKDPLNSLSDLQGKKIGSDSIAAGELARLWGGVPVTVATPDMYMTAQKKTVDGLWFTWAGFRSLKMQEVIKYALDPPKVGAFPMLLVMNKDTYNKMPSDVKAIINEMRDSERYLVASAKAGDDEAKKGKQSFIDAGGIITSLSASDMQEMDKLAKPLWEKSIADIQAKGAPAKDIFATLYSTLKNLGVEKPFIGYTPPSP
jgi:TRAP-type C4-dicarboxylate transport system substrate-binding protein